jgi:hypothetical protein
MRETTPKTAADIDSRVTLMFQIAGYATMSVAVMAYFGFPGAIFILGLLMVRAADEPIK